MIWQQGTLLTYGLAYGCALLGHAVPQTVDEVAQAARDFVARRTPLVTLLTTPMVHATAAYQLHATLALGGTIVLLPRGRVDGDEICAAIEHERVAVLSVVGDVVLRRMVDALEAADARGAPYDISSLLRVHSSGAMVQPPTKDALHARGSMSFYDSLGASEGVGFGLSLTTARGESASGRFKLGTNARVLDGDGNDVVPGSGEPGVLAVAVSTGVGYYNDPARSAATFRTIDGSRYAVPGDWALLHDDGTITLLGRGSGCINTGGEKVWPEEVEESLKGHPAVVDALVVGMPDHDWGEVVAAVVATAPDARVDPDELGEWVGTRLAVLQASPASGRGPRGAAHSDRKARLRVGARAAGLTRHHERCSRTSPAVRVVSSCGKKCVPSTCSSGVPAASACAANTPFGRLVAVPQTTVSGTFMFGRWANASAAPDASPAASKKRASTSGSHDSSILPSGRSRNPQRT